MQAADKIVPCRSAAPGGAAIKVGLPTTEKYPLLEVYFMRRRPAMSTVKRTTTWLAVIVAAATMATAVSASPSFAAGAPANAQATIPGGYGYFTADGQILTARDTKADGYGVVVMYYRYDLAKTGPYYLWDRDGSGTSTYRYLNMPYGGEIKLYACPEQDGIILNYKCGTSAFGYAGSEI